MKKETAIEAAKHIELAMRELTLACGVMQAAVANADEGEFHALRLGVGHTLWFAARAVGLNGPET